MALATPTHGYVLALRLSVDQSNAYFVVHRNQPVL